ncbi:alpha-amylase [Nonlabens mediterrranea]|uniref:Alpha-amylase n=2 Tax=Nonlabens mediterrranea TaxID=1419947 RepID=A0ABS0A234_9FLAO|nr:alpha-amylase [Nonlabens mediterrranea]
MKNYVLFLFIILGIYSCKTEVESSSTSLDVEVAHFDWSAANVYFLLTDRFKNGNASNDTIINRNKETGKLRGFKGGDFAGIIEKIKEGYFTELGVDVIWLTPIWEQIHDGVDEGTGYSYAFHGYWAKDWTTVEPSYGTQADFERLVQLAHDNNIRILLDVVINHTGPVTSKDQVWPADWVRTGPGCTYQDQETAVSCTLTSNLPDIRTDSVEEVELPEHLVQKWKQEGRLESELKELDDFFKRTGLARTPVNYIIKWVTDYARETGVDGFRIDTVKHVEEKVWKVFNEQARLAYSDWKVANPEKKFHDDPFFILGELYGYEASGGRNYFFNEDPVDYFDYGYDAMINFGFKRHAIAPYKELFKRYDGFRDSLLSEKPQDPAYFMNYISSHDDGQPFDATRERTYESATKLLLTPGMAQIYYGDEVARPLIIEGTQGDATLRSMMEWDSDNDELLRHWQKLGQFRRNHPAIGAGDHHSLEHDGSGTIFSRWYDKNGFTDQVIAGAGLKNGTITIDVKPVFKNVTQLRNAYTGNQIEVIDGKITTQVIHGVVLLEELN